MNAPTKSPPLPNDVFGDVDDKRYPAPAEMLHVSISHAGPGIADMIRFYQVVLNMRHVFRISYPAFEFIALSHDDENHRIGILNHLTATGDALTISQGVGDAKSLADEAAFEPRNAPLRSCRIEHTSWRYHSFQDVLVTARRVHDELGIWPRTSRLAGTDITIDYNDPDGNRIELISQSKSKAQILQRIEQQYNMPNAEKQEYSDVYQSFDMEKMLGLFEAGESVDHLRDKVWVKQKVAEGVL